MVYYNLAYGPLEAQRLDLYLPEEESFDLFVYFHGGGLTRGSKGGCGNLFPSITEAGIAVASVDYRLYPQAKYPDFIEDAAAAAAWLKEHINEYGKCDRIFIGGSSAGGYLSMMLCFDSSWLRKYGLRAMDFAGFVHDAGQPTKHFNVLKEAGEDTRRVIVDETAPLYHVGVDAEYPPMLFIVSDQDMANRMEQTQLMLSTLKHFGHQAELIVRNGTHCHYVSTDLGAMVAAFIKK